MTAKRSMYKGQPILALHRTEEDKYPFQFGPSKARLILAHLEDIRKFVAEADQRDADLQANADDERQYNG